MREIWIPGLRRVLRVSLSERMLRREVSDEIRFHIDSRAEELRALGMSPEAARARATAEFGDVKRSERELWRMDRRRTGHEQREEMLMSFIDDVRYAARGLLRRPSLLFVTTTALSIGIAANAIMFGIVDQLLIRAPAHVAAPDQVKRIYYGLPHRAGPVNTYPVVAALQANAPAFSDVSGFWSTSYTFGRGADARNVDVELVSGNYFRLLGVRPQLGRALTPDDDRIPVGERVVVVSDRFWKAALGGSPDVQGQTVVLQSMPFTIVGVAPDGFSGIDRENVDFWLPISAVANEEFGLTWHNEADNWWVQAIARLAPGITEEVAVAQATAAYKARWGELGQDVDSTTAVVLGPIVGTRTPSGMTAESKVSLWLMGVSLIVLVIACANVGNLLIARTVERRREIAVRLALGVSRSRLVRMLLTEAALLATVSAGVALLLALVASRVVQQVLLPGIVWSDSVVDGRILAFTLAVTVACILFAGIAPALQGLRVNVSQGLKVGTRVAGSRGRAQFALLVIQPALSVVLLIGAGLFVRSLRQVVTEDVGIDLARVAQVSMPLSRFGFDTAQIHEVYRRGEERVRALPGVESVTIAWRSAPMSSNSSVDIDIPGRTDYPEIPGGGPYGAVATGDLFATMGTSITRGRNFTAAEERVTSRVLIISEALANAYWPGEDPLGSCVRLNADSACSTIVGVAENVMMFALVRDDRAMVYTPPTNPSVDRRRAVALLVRMADNPDAVMPMIQREMQRLAPNMPFVKVRTFQELVAPQVRPWRLGATMFTLFGIIALVIATVGLYSVMSYYVAQRRQEIGVRMALGARSLDVVRLVAWQGSRATLLGLVLGGAFALFASRWVVDLLYETSPRDMAVYAIAAAALAVASIAASIIPARRSAGVDPALAIRSE